MNVKMLDPRLTIQIINDKVELRIADYESAETHVVLIVSTHNFMQAMGRLADVRCISGELLKLHAVGKPMEARTLEFPLDTDHDHYTDKYDRARAAVVNHCPEGWHPDLAFSNQDSFFTKKDALWARTTIRRWVDKE